VPLAGRHVVVLGRSSIVGRPLSILLSLKAAWADATVTLCHSRTPDWPAIARTGDVVVAAMGRPRAVGADAIAPGAAVVDVGIHRVPDPQRPGKTRLAGDVDEASVAPVAGYLSPVPGGVGPLTVAMLLANTVQARERADRLTRPPVWEEVTGKEQEAGPGTSWGREPA